eukprot:31338-Pelagococcus_subviridis.AAC.2
MSYFRSGAKSVGSTNREYGSSSALMRVVPSFKATSGWSRKASDLGVERRRGRVLKARCRRRDTPAKVLKKRRSPRGRGRVGTSQRSDPIVRLALRLRRARVGSLLERRPRVAVEPVRVPRREEVLVHGRPHLVHERRVRELGRGVAVLRVGFGRRDLLEDLRHARGGGGCRRRRRRRVLLRVRERGGDEG